MHTRTLTTACAGVAAVAAISLGLPAQATAGDPTRPRIPPTVHRVVNTAVSTPHTLVAGQALVAGTRHSSLGNGWYSLSVSSGMVELDETIPVPTRSGGSTTWGTGTWFRQDPTGRFHAAHDHSQFRLRRNGDLALVTARGRQLWHSRTGGSGGVLLTLHRRGNLTLETRSGKVVWASHSGQVQMSGGMSLAPGQQLRDAWETAFPHGTPITLEMQRDGNLVHRCGSKIDWQTHTHVRGSTLRMFRNGALRVVGPSGRVVWSSHSGGNHRYTVFNAKYVWIDSDELDLVWYAHLNYRVC